MFVDGGVELISPVKNCVLRWVGWRSFLATPHQKRACIKRKEKKNSQSYTWSPNNRDERKFNKKGVVVFPRGESFY
jgi:hypothetical protein